MNNRIKELYEQAHHIGVEKLYYVAPCLPPDVPQQVSRDIEVRTLNPEKFAELIIRECAKVIDRGDGAMCSLAETSWCNACRDDILKHFGVE